VFSAIIGVGITKLFRLSPDFENLRWVAGALSVGVASAVMGLTKTTHPPAGATALLAATTPDITELGWLLVPLILLGSVLLIAVGCVTNNIQRQFPMYWWTAADLSRPNEDNIERQEKPDSQDATTTGRVTQEREGGDERPHIVINDAHISVPDWLSLDEEEMETLEVLRRKLWEGLSNIRPTNTELHQDREVKEN
jgi:hypothetical protein